MAPLGVDLEASGAKLFPFPSVAVTECLLQPWVAVREGHSEEALGWGSLPCCCCSSAGQLLVLQGSGRGLSFAAPWALRAAVPQVPAEPR